MPDHEEQSLSTLLTVEQRGELTVLVATTTEQMRDDLLQTFNMSESPKESSGKVIEQKTKDPKLGSEEAQNARLNVQLSEADQETENRQHEKREAALSAPKVQELKSAALAYFDTWRDSVILRIGEAVNSHSDTPAQKDRSGSHKAAHKPAPSMSRTEQDHQTIVNNALTNIYASQPTSLAFLSPPERSTILNAMLLLLLSLESYKAHSRTLLLRLATSLHISSAEATRMETDVAYGLLSAASHMDGSAATDKAQKANASSRKWKVGAASVLGAGLIGITGGLAAPLVAAGIGGLMGGLGLGATAAAGYLGALASSGVLVGGLFGAYGGKMTGKMMDAYAREVEDFAFLPIIPVDQNEEKEKKKRRLRVTIGVSGWLTNEKEVLTPWKVFGPGGEAFALRFELKALLALGNALQNFVSSSAWGYIKKEIIKRTVLAGLWSALMLPIALLKISKVVDNPFSVAKARADKAGEILADALINRAQGERSVSLVGYSLGGRVIYSCLLSLAERKAFGLVDSVVIMGSPMPSDADDWRAMRAVVSGRLINVFSGNDYILAFLYRTSSVQLGVAGLQAVQGVRGVENVDVSEVVSGHLRYQYLVGELLTKVGWADIDETELKFQAQVLQRMAAEDKEREERQAEETDGQIDERKLEDEAKMLEAASKPSAAEQQQQGQGRHFEAFGHRHHAN